RGEGEELCPLPAGGRDRAEAALQAGHALLEGGNGGVGDAAVDVPELLQGEQRRRLQGVLEDEAGGLVNGHRSGAGGGVGGAARVHGPSPEAVGLFLHGGETTRVSEHAAPARAAAAVVALQVALFVSLGLPDGALGVAWP